MEKTQPATQSHGSGQFVRKTYARIDVMVSADIRLSFVPGAERKIEFFRYLPIVLNK